MSIVTSSPESQNTSFRLINSPDSISFSSLHRSKSNASEKTTEKHSEQLHNPSTLDSCLDALDHIEINPQEIKLLERIGSGSYGDVHKGYWHGK